MEDFKQKIRNRPIVITDIAISKVPRTHLQGFNFEENGFIQEQHKRLLETAKEYNDSNEVGILIDIINWDTWLIMGERNNIEMKHNPEAYEAMISHGKNTLMFMHNHPSTSTFSGTDFKTFCNYDSLYFMTVVGNDGSVWVLTKQNGFDSGAALSYYAELAKKYNMYKNNGTRAMKELLKNCDKIGLSYKIGGKKR